MYDGTRLVYLLNNCHCYKMPSFVTQKLFGEDMLQYTFIFFTKCEGYFKNSKYEHLGQYEIEFKLKKKKNLESLKNSPLGGALKVIGDKAIGVESHWKSSATRSLE